MPLFESRRAKERRRQEAEEVSDANAREVEREQLVARSRKFFTDMPAQQRIDQMKRMAEYIKVNGTMSDRTATLGKSMAFAHLMLTSDPAAYIFFNETLAIYNRLMAEAQTIRMSGDTAGVSGVWFALGTVGVLAAATAWRNR